MLTSLIRTRRGVVSVAAVPLTVATGLWLAAAARVHVSEYAALLRELDDARASSRRMEIEDAEIQQRMSIKEQLVTELIAGRTTLVEVAAQFAAVNRNCSGADLTVLRTHPGDSPEERAARSVLSYVAARVPDPAARDAMLCRLEADLKANYGPGVPVQ